MDDSDLVTRVDSEARPPLHRVIWLVPLCALIEIGIMLLPTPFWLKSVSWVVLGAIVAYSLRLIWRAHAYMQRHSAG